MSDEPQKKKPMTVLIDRRPLFQILAQRLTRLFALTGLFLLLWFYLSFDPPEGLSVTGYRSLGAFALCIILWFTQLIPLAITGLLSIVIIPLLDILPSKNVFSFFGNEAVFFILGAFILAAAIMKSGLSTRLAVILLKRKSMTPRKLVLSILLSTAFLSCLMSEHAVAAFFFPIVLEIARALEFEPFGGEYGKTLFLAMAWGCIIGGVITFLGGARVPLAVGMLEDLTGETITFLDYMRRSLPVALPMLGVAYVFLTKYFKVDVTSVGSALDVLEKKSKEQGLVSLKEVLVGVILVGAIFSWIFYGRSIGLANVAIVAVVALFVLKLVSWKDVENYVNWGIILMYGGAITLGQAINSSNALTWLAEKVVFLPYFLSDNLGGTPGFWLLGLLSFLAIVLTEFVSNAAVVALFLPVSTTLAVKFGLPSTAVTYAIAIPCGLAFMLPMGTPASALAFSSGYLKVREMVVTGIWLNLAAFVIFMAAVKWVWPWLGVTV